MGISRYKVSLKNIDRITASVVEQEPIYTKFFISALWIVAKAWYSYRKTHVNFYNTYIIEYERIG